jgi:hypothetical protein
MTALALNTGAFFPTNDAMMYVSCGYLFFKQVFFQVVHF